MSSFLETMLARAKADRQTIVLPEGDDERTLAAAERILADDIADLVILGDAHAIAASPYKLSGARIIDPRTSELREGFAEALYELRKAKGMTAWWPAHAMPRATCCAPACRSSRPRRA